MAAAFTCVSIVPFQLMTELRDKPFAKLGPVIRILGLNSASLVNE